VAVIEQGSNEDDRALSWKASDTDSSNLEDLLFSFEIPQAYRHLQFERCWLYEPRLFDKALAQCRQSTNDSDDQSLFSFHCEENFLSYDRKIKNP
jgi:hypothetical protein